jgi:hypothetical protein
MIDIDRAETIDTVKSKTTPTGYTKTVKINIELNQPKNQLLEQLSDFTESIQFIGQKE